jgi:hypothetical protein
MAVDQHQPERVRRQDGTEVEEANDAGIYRSRDSV